MLTFIIPVYNAEKYILSCVHEIMKISGFDFEIIIVNDGSTDRTGELLGSLCSHQIRIFNGENRGVSAARNVGIAHAKGEYLMFVDADDLVIGRQLEAMVRKLSGDLSGGKGGSDLYLFAYEEEQGGRVRRVPLPVEPGYYTDPAWLAELGNRLLDVKFSVNYGSRYFNGRVYQYFFSREFLWRNRITFPEGICFAEDCVFCLQCLKKAASLTVLDAVGYHYVVYDCSVSHRFRENFWEEMKAFYRCVCEVETSRPQNWDRLLLYLGRDAIWRTMQHFPKITDRKNVQGKVEQVIADTDFQHAVRSVTFAHWSLKEKVFLRLCAGKKAVWIYWWLFLCRKPGFLKGRSKSRS